MNHGRSREAEDPGFRAEGKVREALPNAMYSVELTDGRLVLAHVATGLRIRIVRVLPGDQVVLELSPRDLSRGRIVGKQPG